MNCHSTFFCLSFYFRCISTVGENTVSSHTTTLILILISMTSKKNIEQLSCLDTIFTLCFYYFITLWFPRKLCICTSRRVHENKCIYLLFATTNDNGMIYNAKAFITSHFSSHCRSVGATCVIFVH